MSKQYCYNIIAEREAKQFDEKKLETFVKNLYIGEDKFEDEDKLPFIIITTDTKICIMLKGRGKKKEAFFNNQPDC